MFSHLRENIKQLVLGIHLNFKVLTDLRNYHISQIRELVPRGIYNVPLGNAHRVIYRRALEPILSIPGLAHLILISAVLEDFLFWCSYIKQASLISFVLPKVNFANCLVPSGRDSLIRRRPGLNEASVASAPFWITAVYFDSSYPVLLFSSKRFSSSLPYSGFQHGQL